VGVGGQRHIQAVLAPGKGPSTHLHEAVRAPGPLRMDAEMSSPPAFDPRTLQSVASRYTNYASYPAPPPPRKHHSS